MENKLSLHKCDKINDIMYCHGNCDKCSMMVVPHSRTTEGTNPNKCKWPDGISIKPDGINELDPCIYEEVEVIENCTVRLLRCKYCGHEEWEWERNCED